MHNKLAKWVGVAAGVLLLASSAPGAALVPQGAPTPGGQNWYGSPALPAMFDAQEVQEDSAVPAGEEFLALPAYRPFPEPVKVPPLTTESEFPKLLSVLDIEAWREKDEMRSLREWAGDAFFGVPMIIPQLLLEELIPHGVAVGPTTFLYKNSKDSRSLPLVIFDQALFHEAQFLAQAQSYGDNTAGSENLTRSQRNVLRRSLMSGFRATYALPSLSMDVIRETAAEAGIWAYLVAPAAGGALLYLKGIDQKVSIHDVVKARVQVTSGRQWIRAGRASEGMPVLNCEMKFCDLPVALIISVEMSDRGMTPQFIGLGTSLDVVEDLISRQKNKPRPQD